MSLSQEIQFSVGASKCDVPGASRSSDNRLFLTFLNYFPTDDHSERNDSTKLLHFLCVLELSNFSFPHAAKNYKENIRIALISHTQMNSLNKVTNNDTSRKDPTFEYPDFIANTV